MRVAIIDDDAWCRQDIREHLSRYLEENFAGESPVIEEFRGGEEFLCCFVPEAYDIIFLDQYMNGVTGIDTAREIRQRDALAAIIFVTYSRDHAVDSYEVRACGYLVKPYEYGDFEKTMKLAGMEKIRGARFIRLEQEKILLREILWCDQDGHYVQIHTEKRGVLRFRLSFGQFILLIKKYPQFLICYKGCVINMERVERMDDLDFITDTGEKVPFSKRDRRKIQTLYWNFLFQREREEELL